MENLASFYLVNKGMNVNNVKETCVGPSFNCSIRHCSEIKTRSIRVTRGHYFGLSATV